MLQLENRRTAVASTQPVKHKTCPLPWLVPRPLQAWRGVGMNAHDICSRACGYQTYFRIHLELECDYLTHTWNHMKVDGTLVFNQIKQLRVQAPLILNPIPPSSLSS